MTTMFFTVATFVIGQIIDRLLIQPIQEQKKIVGEIRFALHYYANRYLLDDKRFEMTDLAIKKVDEASEEIRRLGSQLVATTRVIPFYAQLSHVGLVLNTQSVDEAFVGCTGWSNSITDRDDKEAKWEFRKKIAKAIGVDLI